MKFKEIKPGMVIHCPKEEDAKALMDHMKDIGYSHVDYMTAVYSVYGENTCYKVRWNCDERLSTEYSLIELYRDECQYAITEFSDLIERDDSPINSDIDSPMTAVEVLEWLSVHDADCIMQELFSTYSIHKVLEFSPQEVVNKITAYEATKKAPKPVDVKHGWCCEIFWVGENGWEPIDDEEVWGVDENAAKDHAAEMARRFIAYHVANKQYVSGCKEQSEAVKNALEDGKTVAYRVFGICRIKEGES